MKKDMSVEKENLKRTPPPSFVKLAMKNMVRKGNQSLVHFGLTAIGFIALILCLAVLGRPAAPN